jgi:hypothetical protein
MDALLTIIALVAALIAVDLADIPWGSTGRRPFGGGAA